MTETPPPRDDERRRTLCHATMFGDHTPLQPVLVRNMSSHGLGILAERDAPALGEALFISLPDRGDVSGTVRWVEGRAFGVLLDEALHLSQLHTATRRRSAALQPMLDLLVDQHLRPPPVENAPEGPPVRPV